MKHVTCCDVVLLLLALARVVALAKYICCLSYYLYYDRHVVALVLIPWILRSGYRGVVEYFLDIQVTGYSILNSSRRSWHSITSGTTTKTP